MNPLVFIKQRKKTRAISFIALLAFVVCLLPVPVFPPSTILPQFNGPNGSSDENVPYPCQGGVCGCNSPEKCWTSCCCRTPEERLAWATEKGVVPPAYAVLSSQPAVVKTSVAKACCSNKNKSKAASVDTYCGTSSASDKKSCAKCSTKSDCAFCKAKQGQETCSLKAVRGKHRWALAMEAAKCNGIRFDLQNAFYLLPSPVEAGVPQTLPSYRASTWVPSPTSPVHDVDIPPPRSLYL